MLVAFSNLKCPWVYFYFFPTALVSLAEKSRFAAAFRILFCLSRSVRGRRLSFPRTKPFISSVGRGFDVQMRFWEPLSACSQVCAIIRFAAIPRCRLLRTKDAANESAARAAVPATLLLSCGSLVEGPPLPVSLSRTFFPQSSYFMPLTLSIQSTTVFPPSSDGVHPRLRRLAVPSQ